MRRSAAIMRTPRLCAAGRGSGLQTICIRWRSLAGEAAHNSEAHQELHQLVRRPIPVRSGRRRLQPVKGALCHWKVGAGSKVAVVGLGGLGHMGLKLAKAMGAEVTLFSRSPGKEADARRLGADHIVISTDA